MTNQPTIKQGMKPPETTPAQDAAIRTIQKFLNIKVDGNYGPGTTDAVKAYQRSRSLKDDGIVGEKTWATIPANPALAPLPKPVATANAATSAANTIKNAPKIVPPGAVLAKPPAPIQIPNKAPIVKSTAMQATRQAVVKAVTTTKQAATKTAKNTVVAVKRQPMWVRIVGAATLAMGGVFGYKAITKR